MMRSRIFTLAFILLAPVRLFAVDYYLDNTVSTCADYRVVERDCGSGSEQNYASIAEANAVLTAGDTLWMRGGSEAYQEYAITASSGAGEGIQPDNSGTDYDHMITYQVYNDEMVHLAGDCDDGSCKDHNGIYLYGNDYIKISGGATNKLKISHCYKNLFIGGDWTLNTVYSRYNEIANIWSTDNTDAASSLPNTLSYNAQYNWIHDCKFEKSGSSLVGEVFVVGISTSPTSESHREHVAEDFYNIIEGCEFSNGGHSTFQLLGQYNIARNNYIHNEAWMTSGEIDYSMRNLISHQYYPNCGHNIFEGNRIGHADRTLGDAFSGSGWHVATSDYIIRYNSFFNNGGEALEFRASYYADTYYLRSNNNYAYNNTFYYNGMNEGLYTSNGVVSFITSSNQDFYTETTINWQAVQDNVIKNNLFYDNISNQRSESVFGTNDNMTSAQACPSSSTQGCNVLLNNYNDDAGENTDPKFINTTLTSYDSWTLPNLNLKQDSPVIDQGTYLTQVNDSGGGSGTSLVVDDAAYFQDGKFGSASGCDPTKWPSGASIEADFVCVGTTATGAWCEQIDDVNYSTNTITLSDSKSWSDDDYVWLQKKSDGEQVLYGDAPDYGANEYQPTATCSGTSF
jgi:hypothetical protein